MLRDPRRCTELNVAAEALTREEKGEYPLKGGNKEGNKEKGF
jgi:hypothetical protein